MLVDKATGEAEHRSEYSSLPRSAVASAGARELLFLLGSPR